MKSLVDIAVSLKTKFKRHILQEFHGYSWAFCPGTARVKALKKKEEKEDDEIRFSPLHFQICHFKQLFRAILVPL